MSEVKRRMKCVVVGDSTVGKTCILISYTTNRFPSESVPTLFENYAADLMVDGTQVEMALWDTSGIEDNHRLRPLAYPDTNVFIVCLSINSFSSFDSITTRWIEEIRHHCPDVPIILVGTKLDLRNDNQCLLDLAAKGMTQITREHGEELARKINARMYLECSALTQQGLERVFDEAARAVLESNPRQKKKVCVLL